MRSRLATYFARLGYRRAVIDDRPRSELYFALRYGSWSKIRNFLRVRRDYRAQRTTVECRPYIVRIEPTSACNLHCPLCPTGRGELDRPNTIMSPEALDRILSRCGEHALFAVLWIWGEPLLNKKLDQLAAVCRRHGIGSEVSTHLSLPLSEERIDSLVRSGLDWLIVSIDAATAATYEQYRIGGDFERVLANLRAIVARKKALRSATPFIEWQFVPLRHNEGEMQQAVKLAAEIGVDGVRFKPARLDKPENHTFVGDIPVQVERQWAASDPALVHRPLPGHGAFHDFHCPFLWASVSVYGDGSVAPCCETTSARDDLGNVLANDFESIWNGPTYHRARRAALGRMEQPGDDAVACKGCKVFRKPAADAVPHG
jgi:MoaA/NifB/PqqE/SkfB family radical SAM enzyme